MYDAHVDYKVYAVGDQAKPKITRRAKASSGGGFGVGSALRVAAFAGQMYMSTMTMGMGMGMGACMGMMGSAASFGGLGGLSGLGGMGGMMNPGMAAMSIMSGRPWEGAGCGDGWRRQGGMGDRATKRRTVQDALSKAGKQVADELKKGRSTASSEKK